MNGLPEQWSINCTQVFSAPFPTWGGNASYVSTKLHDKEIPIFATRYHHLPFQRVKTKVMSRILNLIIKKLQAPDENQLIIQSSPCQSKIVKII